LLAWCGSLGTGLLRPGDWSSGQAGNQNKKKCNAFHYS